MGTSSGSFAVLSEHRRWRFTVFFMLYVAQGVPFGLILIALPAYMAQRGIDPLSISAFLGTCMLPHAIKLVNGPIMDRWTYWPMGKRRPWVLIAQIVLVMTFASIALVPDPLQNLPLLTTACFAVNYFAGFQDVATDGMAVDVLPLEDQSKASSIMFGGAMTSGAMTAAIGGWALSRYGIALPALVCAAVIALISMFMLISRERPGERLLPWSRGQATLGPSQHRPDSLAEIGRDLKRYFLLRASLLLVTATVVYQFGRGIVLSMMPVYYVQEIGWADTEYSRLTGSALLLGGMFSILFGGAILDYLGRVRAFAVVCFAIALLGLLLAVAPGVGASDVAMTAYRLTYMTLDTLVIVGFIAVAMAICTRQVAATQFAIYMGLGNVGYTGGSAAFGPLHAILPYEAVFALFACVTVGAIFAMKGVSIADHNARVLQLQAASA